MSSAEQFSGKVEATQGVLDRLEVVRRLGKTAIDLALQIENIYESMDALLEPESSVVAPAGMAFYVRRTDHNNLHVEAPRPEIHASVWSKIYPKEYGRHGISISHRPDGDEFRDHVFLGTRIEYDYRRNIWVCGEDNRWRVLLEEGVALDLVPVQD